VVFGAWQVFNKRVVLVHFNFFDELLFVMTQNVDFVEVNRLDGLFLLQKFVNLHFCDLQFVF
jgi:hypothetical protein